MKLQINPDRDEVLVNGKRLHLTPKEQNLFFLLYKENKTISRESILDAVWGIDAACEVETLTVDIHIGRIRRKFKKAGIKAPLIRTVCGKGFVWDGI